MCGIFGTFRYPPFDVERGLDRLKHRGPDGRGIFRAGDAVHGHVRLALLDLSEASAQPFLYRDGVLSFNGEIWNYRDLRRDLEVRGHTFRSTGDTEILAAALHEWGRETLPRLDGMFAFAWSRGDEHLLVRDRFGKIPLYVERHGQGFVWASERKALDHPGAAVPLPPGSFLDLQTGKVHEWYSVPRLADPDTGSVLQSLREGVRKRLHADAPVACLISGGLDSSLILALAQKVNPNVTAYTAVFDPRSEDLKAARRLCGSLGIELREVAVPEITLDGLRRAVAAIEVNSKAQIEIALLCLPLAQQIASDGFKACLSGESADELFGGYGNMCIRGSRADDAGWREIRLGQLAKMSRGNFVRCNKVFMAHGVECRLPFMERSLVETVLSLGKADCPPGKKLLKQIAKDILPPEIIRRPKETFQGGSGVSRAVGRLIASPVRYYNAETKRVFGKLVTA